MGPRFWVGQFSYRPERRAGWVRERRFCAVHDKLFLPQGSGEGEVCLYTSEYDAIAKFPVTQLKLNWNMTSLSADFDFCNELAARCIRAQAEMRLLARKYVKGQKKTIPSRLKIYEEAFLAGHDLYPEEYIHNEQVECSMDVLVPLFVPPIESLWRAVLRAEVQAEQDELMLENYVSADDIDPCPGFDGDDHAEAKWMLIEELLENEEDYYRAREDGWFYEQ